MEHVIVPYFHGLYCWGSFNNRPLNVVQSLKWEATQVFVQTIGSSGDEILDNSSVDNLTFTHDKTIALTNQGRLRPIECQTSDAISDYRPYDYFQRESIHVKDVASGYGHVIVLDSNGRLFSWGSSFCGALGLGPQLKQASSPSRIRVSIPDESNSIMFTNIASSMHHVCAISSHGDLYVWGNAQGGALGIYAEEPNQFSPVRLSSITHPVRLVACGDQFTIAVCEDSDEKLSTWSWGLGSFGRLGTGSTKSQWSPAMIRAFKAQIVEIACGDEHTIALSKEGYVYTWGRGLGGRLGLGRGHSNAIFPKRVIFNLSGTDRPCRSIAAGNQHSAVITRDTNQFFVFGCNCHYQLGVPKVRDRRSGKAMDEIDIPFEIGIPGTDCGGINAQLAFDRVFCGTRCTIATVIDARPACRTDHAIQSDQSKRSNLPTLGTASTPSKPSDD